jgi:hypothetical protein
LEIEFVLEGKRITDDLNLGLIKVGPEKIVAAMAVTAAIISRCHFHLITKIKRLEASM